MDNRKLQHLICLADTGNFARAAEKLAITQPALSRSIQALEAELGLRLFDRGRGGVSITPHGRDVVRQARDLLGRFETLKHNVSLLATGETGRLSMGFAPLPASIVLPDLLSRFVADCPSAEVHPSIGSPQQLLSQLRDHQIEFCVMARARLNTTTPDVSIRGIGELAIGVLARRGHPLVGRDATDEEIGMYPMLGAALAQDEGVADPYLPNVTCNDSFILQRVVERSDALWLTADKMRTDKLAALTTSLDHRTEIVVVSMADRTLSPLGQRAIKVARQILR